VAAINGAQTLSLEEKKKVKKAAIHAEAMGEVDGFFGGQRGKNDAIAHAILELYNHVEAVFGMLMIDTETSPEYKKLMHDKKRLLHYDEIIAEMYRCLHKIDICDSEDCINELTPKWPDQPQADDYGTP